MSDFNEEFAIELGLRLKNGAIASIQKQLNQLSGQSINLNIGGSVDATGVKQEVDKLVNDVNKSTENVEPIKLINATNRKAFEAQLKSLISDEEVLQRATRKHFGDFGKVTTNIFRDAKSNIQSFVVQIENAKGEIESLRYKWEELKDAEGNILKDEQGNSIEKYFYKGSSGSDNYAKVVKQAVKQEQVHQQQIDRNNAAITRYTATLESLRTKYEDINASKAIANDDHQEQLRNQYDAVITAIDALGDADKITFASMKANVDSEISKLRSMIAEFQNAEYAANQLRAKPIEVIKQDEINLLREFEARIKQSGVDFSNFGKIDGLAALTALKEKAEAITNKESLTAYLNLLSNVKTEWKALVQERRVEIQQDKEFSNNINADYQSLLSIMKEIGNTQISLLKSDPEKDSNKINVLKSRLSELYSQYTDLFEVFDMLAPKNVVRELNDEWLKIEKSIELVKAKVADTTAEKKAQQAAREYSQMQKESAEKKKVALQEEENEYKRLIDLVSQIGKIRTTLIGLDSEKDSQQIAVLKEQLHSLFSEYTQAKMSFATNFPTHSLDGLHDKWQEITNDIRVAKARVEDLKIAIAQSVKVKIADKTLEGQISSLETKFQKLHINSQEINDDFTKLRTLMANMDGIDDIESVNADYQEYLKTLTNVKNKVAELQRQQSLQRDSVTLNNQRATLSSQIDVWLHKNSAAARQFGDELEKIKAQIDSADKMKLSQLKSQFQDVKRQAELAGKTGLSLIDGFKRSLKTVSTYFSGMMLITRSISLVRKMYTDVLQVDTAMTELYRVTDLTSSQYSKLYDNMTNSAKNYGATLDSIIKSTASWVRLGFDAETSNKLAEITSIYQHVTDLDEGTAVKNLVTAYKGYQSELLQVSGGDSAKAVTKVADVYDKIGNEFAISASDIGESMRRSAASLEMAGNTFEEAVGMNTGIAEVTQNAEQAGTAINVVSLRLRGMKGQLEEIGEEVDENVESISKMQTHILNLTNGKVNIFKDNGDFKSTYQIFKEIDAVWKDLTDTSQADLLETIAGKQRANAIAALLNNFSQAEKAVQAASNAEGTATKENEKYLKSMQGRIDSMKASAQALSNSFLSSDLLKGLISGASTLLNITDGLIKNFGALPTLIAAVTAALSFKNIGIFKINEQGNGITSILGSLKAQTISFSSSITDAVNQDKNAITDYISAVVNGTKPQEAFAQHMTDASQAAQQYVNSLKPATLAVDDIKTHLRIFEQQQTQSNVALIAQNKSLSNCRSIIATYNKGYEQLGLTQEQFVDSVKQGNSSLGNYLANIKNGKALMAGYVGSLIKAKAASIGLKVATMALNGVISLAVSAGLSLLIQGISDWIHAAEKSAEKAKEAAQSIQELKDSFDSLDDYQKKINDINDALDSGALSHQEAKDKREELMAIQDEIIKKYGKEKGAIDTITDAIRGERDALDELKKIEAGKWNQEHQSDIEAAQKFLNENLTLKVSWDGRDSQGFKYVLDKDHFTMSKAQGHTNLDKWDTWSDYQLEPTYFLQEWLKTHNNASFKHEYSTKYGTSINKINEILFTGTREETLASYQELYNAIEDFVVKNNNKLTQEQRDLYENLKTGVSNSIRYITEGANGDNAYNSNKEVLQQAIENEILNNDELGKLYQQYQSAISAYRVAETTGDEEIIAEAYRNERDAFNALLNTARDVGKVKKEQIQQWVKDTQSEFDSATDHERLVVDVSAEIEIGNNVSSDIKGYIEEEKLSYEELLKEASDANSPVAVMIQSYVDTFNSSADAMGVAKISVEDYINALLRLGIVHKEVSADAKENPPFVLDKDQTSALKAINSDIDKLNDAYSKLFNNKLTDNDVYELIELFPKLGEYVDFTADKFGNLAEGLDVVIKQRPQDLINELEKIDTNTLTEQGKKFLEYTINSLKSVHAELKATESYFKSISGVINTLIGLEKELDENGSLSLSSIDTIMTDDSYKSLRPLINDIPKLKEAIKSLTDEQKKAYEELYNDEQAKQYSAKRVKSIQDEVTEIKKKYDIDSDNWEDLQNTKQEILINTNNEILFKQNQAINDFARLYGVDLSNFSDAVKAKEEIMRNFYKSQAFQDVRNIVGDSFTYDQTTGQLNINNDAKRQQVNSLLASQGLTWQDYLSYLQGTGFTTTGSSNMERIIQEIIGKYTPTTINWDNALANNNLSGGSGGSTSTTKQFFDWIERRLKLLADNTKRTFAKVADYISYTWKNNQLTQTISALRSEESANQQAYDTYIAYANSVSLDEYYKWQVRNGSMQIDQIQDSNLQEKINKYKEYYDAAMACSDAIEQLKQQEKEYAVQMLSNIDKYFNNRIQYAASDADYYNSLDTDNLYLAKNFTAINKSYKQQIVETENKKSNLNSTLSSLMQQGLITDGSDEWYEWKSNIDNCTVSIRNLTKSMRELASEELKVIQSGYENKNTLSQNIVSNINAIVDDTTRNVTKDYNGLAREYNTQIANSERMIVDLKKRLDEAVDTGDIEMYSNKWYEWTGIIQKGETDIIELKKNIHELSVEQFNDIQKSYDHQIQKFEQIAKQLENKNKELELRGRLSSTKYYQALAKNTSDNINALKKEFDALESKLSNAVSTGDIQFGSEQWYTLREAIDSVNSSIDEGNLKLLEYAKTIREIEWGYFDYLLDRITQINSEAEFLIELMSNDKLYDDTGNITSKGKASMGLYAQNYDVDMYQANMYADEIKKINQQLANDPNNTELIKRKEELVAAQQKSILAAEKEKKAIVDLVKNGIELQLSALKKLIDQYTKSLDQAKNLYDYQKNIEDKTSNIAKIRKQLLAYENDSSEETKTKIQQLQVSLKEAENDLQETEYEKFISDTKELLDDLYSDYEKILNDRLDNIDQLFADMVDVVNENASNISMTIKDTAKEVGYTISNNLTDIWDGNNNSVVTYSSDFSKQLTNINMVLTSINNYVSHLIDGTVAIGQIDGSGIKTSGSNTITNTGNQSGVGVGVNTSNTVSTNTTRSSTGNIVPTNQLNNTGTSQSTSINNKEFSTNTSSSKSKGKTAKENYGVALAIINGNYGWGAGSIRKQNLESKGFDYDTIQGIVNKLWEEGYISNGSWVGRYYGITDLSAYHINKYQHGGLVDYTGLAQVDGTPSKPEAFLDAEDTKNIAKLLNHMRALNMTNSIGLGNYNFLSNMYGKLSNQFDNGFQIGNVEINVPINIDHVQDYNDFVRQLQNDKKFENMVQDMTVGKLSGYGSLSKNKYIWH